MRIIRAKSRSGKTRPAKSTSDVAGLGRTWNLLLRYLVTVLVCAIALLPMRIMHIAHAAGVLAWNTGTTSGPIALARPAVAVGQDGNIYVFGGTTGDDTDYNTTFIYQPSTNSWSLGANMPVAREGARAVTLPDGRIAVLGGGTQCAYNELCSNGTVYNRVDVYTPGTESWSTLAPMQSPRYRFAAVLYQGQIYAIGGSDGTQAVSSVEAYDPISDTWTSMTSLPVPEVAPAAAVDNNDQIDVFGGFDGVATIYNNLFIYNGSGWNDGATLPQATEDAGATVGSDGQVYLVGGFDASWLTTVQSYDPNLNSWSPVTSLPTPTCCMGAVTIPSGQMYVVAGGGSASSQVAIYGPTISLSPPIGPAGSIGVLNGTNFAPQSNVSVYWGTAATGMLLGTGTTDGSGALTNPITFTVPTTAVAGAYSVTALDDQSQYPVTTSFVVPAPGPAIPSVAPASGSYRNTVRITGANFKPGEPVSLYWDRIWALPRSTTLAAANGTFSTTMTVPQAVSGRHTIIALGRGSYLLSRASFVVRSTTMLLHSITPAGSQDTLRGYGFPARQRVNVYWKTSGPGGLLLGTATTNVLGTLSGTTALSFTVPSSAPGPYDIISLGTSNGGLSTLTLTP